MNYANLKPILHSLWKLKGSLAHRQVLLPYMDANHLSIENMIVIKTYLKEQNKFHFEREANF